MELQLSPHPREQFLKMKNVFLVTVSWKIANSEGVRIQTVITRKGNGKGNQ